MDAETVIALCAIFTVVISLIDLVGKKQEVANIIEHEKSRIGNFRRLNIP